MHKHGVASVAGMLAAMGLIQTSVKLPWEPRRIKWNWRDPLHRPFTGPVGATEEQRNTKPKKKGKGTRKSRRRA